MDFEIRNWLAPLLQAYVCGGSTRLTTSLSRGQHSAIDIHFILVVGYLH
jgi:hypothetical protein